jgi:hypothetical protein
MQPGDMVYYLYTDKKHDNQIKFAASVLSVEAEGIRIVVGRFDVLSSKLETFESVVSADKLLPRNTPCSFEDELKSA